MQAAVRSETRWLPRFLLVLALSLGLLIMHGMVAPLSPAAPDAGAMTTVAMADHSCGHVAGAAAMSMGSMDCAGMVTGFDPVPVAPDTPVTVLTRSAVTVTAVRSGSRPASGERRCPEVLRT